MRGILGHRRRFFAGMNSRRRLSAAYVVCAALALPALPAGAEQVRNHFDSDAIMRVPGFFDLVELGPPARTRWLILTDPNPPSAPYRLAQTDTERPADSIAAALRRGVTLQDGSASTFIKQGPSRAGLLLRMRDEKNFLLLLVDTGSGDVVLSSYRDGQASELGRGHGAFARGWEKIGVRLAGRAVAVSFNDQMLFDATDPGPVSGRIGVATAGPGEASFDEFLIEPAEAKR
jgi:hypothetical protein